jgi:hypothetical protein
MMRALLAACAFVATVGAAQPPPAPTPQPPPVQTESPAPGEQPTAAVASAAPTTVPTSVPTAVGTPTPAPPTPTPAPTPVYRYVFTPKYGAPIAGLPRILEIDMTDRAIHTNSDIALRVVTTPEVQSVVASAMGRDIAIPQQGPGVFAAQSHIPDVPFFLLRTYNVEFRAAAPDGQIATITLPLRLTR